MAIKGVVAAGHALTVQAAEQVLLEGGNAFDAILAAHFTACVVEPVLASLGGGGFLLAKPAGISNSVIYDFFVQTPKIARPADEVDFRPVMVDFGTAQQEFHIGLGTIATPGSVKGMFEIYRDLCSMPMKDIVAPAVDYARSGFNLNSLQTYIFNIVAPIYNDTPEAQEIYGRHTENMGLDGEKELFRLPDLADTLEILAIEGEDLFYRGEIAQSIADRCAESGNLTRDDLASYQVSRRRPLCTDYRGIQIQMNPPPSSGGILIVFALELLKQVDFTKLPFGTHCHLRMLAEVMSLTNKARIDALDGHNNHSHDDARLLNHEYLETYRQQVAQRAQSLRGTTHISVIDAQGNIASMTVSNGEGCGSIVPQTGIMLNNMLGEEDLNPKGFHHWPVDQRMTSMMTPTMLQYPGGRIIASGSGGSNRIRTALLQVLINVINYQMDIADAVCSPRIHIEADKLSVEGGYISTEVERLIQDYPKHEVWRESNLFFGGAHTVEKNGREFQGVGDPRRDGVHRVVV